MKIINQIIILSIISMLLLTALSGCGFFEVDEGISAAVKAGDPSMCAKLEDDGNNRIDKCYDQVAQRIKDPTACNKIQTNDRKDDCFGGIAVKLEDGDLCDKVIDREERNNCFSGVSERTLDTDLCDKIESLHSEQKTTCLTNAAIGKDDVNICLNLKNKEDQGDCISRVAMSDGDISICDKLLNPSEKTNCQVNVAVNSRDIENCDKITSVASREACVEQLSSNSGPKTCKAVIDCSPDELCIESKCLVPDCTEDSQYCRGDKIEHCNNGRISISTCIYGCKDDDCLTKEEKDKIVKAEEAKNVCEEKYKTCLSDTTLEYCESGIKTEKLCEFGCKKGKCNEETEVDLSGTIKKMKERQEFAEVVSGPYMQALDLAIDKEKDASKKTGLEAYKEFLGSSADKYGEAVATLEDLEKLKRIFIDQYDPSMDIENMDARDILEKGLTDRLSDAVSGLWPFGGKKGIEQQEQEQAEEQLKVYKAMLERKQEIEFLKKSRLSRVGDTMVGIVKDKLASTVKEKAEEMAEAAGGTAFATVGILSTALDTVQDEAQNMMFTGLIKAYNRRRNALEEQYPGKSNEEIHRLTVEDVEDFPYADAKTGVIIAKYGNLLANEDCTVEGNSNPLCIDRHAFWVSMDKSYEHINDKKLFKRWLAQMESDE